MLINKARIAEAVNIYETIALAKSEGKKSVELQSIDFDENVKALQDVGYTVKGNKIEWKEI